MIDFHDSSLVGINYDDLNLTLELRFRLSNSFHVLMLFSDCTIFKINNFCNQNLVHSLLIKKINECNEEYALKTINNIIYEESDNYKNKDVFDKIMSTNKNNNFLILEPSWGAEILAIFNNFHSEILDGKGGVLMHD